MTIAGVLARDSSIPVTLVGFTPWYPFTWGSGQSSETSPFLSSNIDLKLALKALLFAHTVEEADEATAAGIVDTIAFLSLDEYRGKVGERLCQAVSTVHDL